jgi:hypothetical protein
MKSFIIVALLGMLGMVAATCPNLCNGHGTCGSNDRCTCFNNWQGADCSERVCAYGLAWVDAPSALNTAHWYAECSNKGICDRETGECACFAGYEGKGCRRSSCPNDCSGHGTCYYINQVAKDTNDPTSRKLILNKGSGDGSNKIYYNNWDANKAQACVCDPYYEGADCSLRQCPRGDNILTTGSINAAGQVEAKDQANTVQEFIIHQGTTTNAMEGTFTLTYTDVYGGVWETEAISVKDTAHVLNADLATRVEAALENLPNGVLEDVTVTAVNCGGDTSQTSGTVGGYTGVDCSGSSDADDLTKEGCSGGVEFWNGRLNGGYLGHFTSSIPWITAVLKAEDATGTGAVSGDYMLDGQCIDMKVEFSGDQNAGEQPLLQVNIAGCTTDGCAPYYGGITDADVDGTTAKAIQTGVVDVTTQVVSGSNKRMHKERAVCSEHGICDSSTGTCGCFSGYYDEDCSKQTVLV